MEPITTVKALYSAFGGDEAFRAATGATERQSATWKNRGYLPGHARLTVFLAAHRRGIQIAPELVGLPSLEVTE